MSTLNPKYNLIVSINGEKVLRTENTPLNKIQIQELFKGEKYKLVNI